jgi:hypothetical protein
VRRQRGEYTAGVGCVVDEDAAGRWRARLRVAAAGREVACPGTHMSEEDTKLAQKLDQLQPFMAVFRLECMGQLAYFGLT